MYIKEIELNNFRIYKGLNKISLLPEDDKNIVVVSGKNGFGKTTFLMSLVWCMYGKQMKDVDELYEKEIQDKGNYAKYIAGSLNRKAQEEGETKFSVAITFTDVKIPDVICNEVKIIRTYNTITAAADKVQVLIDGYPNELINDLSKDNQDGAEIFIRDFILPIEIAKFFFFDAEKIVSLAEVNSNHQRRQISKAYSEVLGIQKYENLKKTLEEKQDDYRRRSASPDEKIELNDLQTKIDNSQIKIDGLHDSISEKKDKRAEKKKESDEIQTKLIREGEKMSVDELTELKTKKDHLEEEKSKLQGKLKDLFDLIPFALSGEILISVSEQLKKERTLEEQKYKQDNVNEKIDKIRQEIEENRLKLEFSTEVKTRDFYEEQIKVLIKKHFFSDFEEVDENLKVLHGFSNSESRDLDQMINTLQHSFKASFKSLNEEYSSIRNQVESIARKIRDAEKNAEDEYISTLREKKASLDLDILSLEGDIESYNIEIGQIDNQNNALKARQETLRKKIDESSKYSEKEKKTKQLIARLQDFIAKFKEEKKRSLEKKMLTSLKSLMHKKGFIKKVEVDISLKGDDIDIILYNKSNKKIDKGALSMGERQMYASALLNALVDESDIEFPVFIDSPMQKFDEEHAKNIIKHFYPNVSKQVVIFPLINKELTEQEYIQLQDNVCKAYLINNVTTGVENLAA